ncbi:PAS domain S-box protein [Halomarina litorea]|uniref:PAS domain S-box protein n=1 Tax=Halomarina litorea TaxID=2961595 RepID=UPI0020C4B63A|nr:PAS domain S-box protein [Halomarina sp. BCD28]
MAEQNASDANRGADRPGADAIRLLYVDDDPAYLDTARAFLEREYADVVVDAVTDAATALDRLDGADCVVSDYEMPGMDGIEFLRAVRVRDPTLPFVLFTGRGGATVERAAREAGATDYLRKGGGTAALETLGQRLREAVASARVRTTGPSPGDGETRPGGGFYRTLVEQNLVGIYLIQNDRFRYVNPRLAELFGYEQSELLDGISPADLVSESYRDVVRSRLRDRLEGRVSDAQYVFEGLRKDGSTLFVEVHGSYVEYEGAPAVLGSLIDVTEREERREELLRYREMLEAIGDGLYLLDLDGRLIDCNAAVESITGYDRTTLLGEHVSLVLDGTEVERIETVIHDLMESGATHRVTQTQVVIVRRDGERVPCELTLSFLPRGPEGKLRGTVGILRNVSERRQRERRYEAIFDQTYQFTGLLSPDGTLLEANETALAFGGLTREAVVGKPIWETGWFADDDATQAMLRDLVEQAAGGEFVRREVEVHGPTDVVTTDFSIKPVTDENGEVDLLIPEARDITERVRIERELRESRRQYSTLLSNLPGMAYRCTNEPDWPMEFVSDGSRELAGYPPRAIEAGDPTWGEVVHPDDREAVWETVQTALDRRHPFELTYRIRTSAGEVRWVWEQGQGVFDDGEVRALEGFIADITQRHRMERELRAGERALRRLADVASRMDLTFDEKLPRILVIGCERLGMDNGHLTRVSEAADEREVVATSGDHELTPSGVTSLSTTPCARTVAARSVHSVHDAARLTDGGDRWGSLGSYIGVPMVTDDEVVGTLCFVSDAPRETFSDAEQTFVSLMLQWIRFEVERETHERRLRRENERLEDFASIVSHDLRNPLDVVSLNLDLARRDEDLTRLDAIERATRRMNGLIDDLLTLTRQGRVVGKTTLVDLERVARAAWESVDTRGATLEIAPDVGSVPADEARLLRVFENLFRNAVEHAGDVTVRVGPLSGGFYVEDDGPGIPPEEREAVFDHGHTTRQGGTGLGLAIVRDIVEAHSWAVAATEGETGGARFEVVDDRPSLPTGDDVLG